MYKSNIAALVSALLILVASTVAVAVKSYALENYEAGKQYSSFDMQSEPYELGMMKIKNLNQQDIILTASKLVSGTADDLGILLGEPGPGVLYWKTTGTMKVQAGAEYAFNYAGHVAITSTGGPMNLVEFKASGGDAGDGLMLAWTVNGYEIKPDVNLSMTNLSGCDLKQTNLNGAYLKATNLTAANLYKVHMIGADLTGASLANAYVIYSRLDNIILNDADLTKVDLRFAWMEGAQLQRANLSEARLQGTHLRYADLTEAKLNGATLDKTDLTGAKLIGAAMNDIKYPRSSLSAQPNETWSKSTLSRADLTNAKLEKSDLTGAILTYATLSGADLFGTVLTKADLTQAKLNSVQGFGVILSGAKLTGADLSGARLQGSKLDWTDLSNANLTGVDMTDGNLWYANLSNANLTNANLTNVPLNYANLTGADLSGANLTNAHLTGAILDDATWTDGSRCRKGSYGICVTTPPNGSVINGTTNVTSLTPQITIPATAQSVKAAAALTRQRAASAMNAEALTLKTRYFILFEGERPLLAIEISGSSVTIFEGVLRYGRTYEYYVMDVSTTNELIGLHGPATFSTPARPSGLDDSGNPLIAQGLKDAAGNSILLADNKLSTLLAAGSGSLPQGAMLTAIQNAGGIITDENGTTLAEMNGNDVRVVRSQGGQGSQIVMAASDTGIIMTIKPLNSSGYSVDTGGILKSSPDVAVNASGVNLPLGLFDFTVSIATDTNRTNVVIVPPTPFASNTKWYKVLSDSTLKEYPHFTVDADGNGILTLYDNDEWDKNPAYGIIRDPGGPGTPATSGGGGGCFIATAAYGSYLHPFVEILRTFRDTVLLASSFGSSFVEWYYRVSPPIAEVIAHNGALSAGVRIMLLPVIGLAWLCLKAGVVPAAFMLLLFCAFIAIVIRSVRRRSAHPAP